MTPRLWILVCALFMYSESNAQVDPGQFVDPFTGQFNYSTPVVSIPGPGGSGYTVNLTYQSGVRPEDEASWVGFGWGLDLPVISREKRGLPDDYFDADVKFLHRVPDHVVTMIRPWAYLELLKFDKDIAGSVGVNGSLTILYDTEFGFDLRLGAGLKASYEGLSSTFSAEHGGDFSLSLGYSWSHGFKGVNPFGVGTGLSLGNLLSVNRAPAFMGAHNASIRATADGGQLTVKKGDILTPTDEIGISYLSFKTVTGNMTRKAFGFLYHEHALASNQTSALLDYETDRMLSVEAMDAPYSPIPLSMPDHFHVSGQGVDGTFRAFSRLPFDCHPPYSKVDLPPEPAAHLELYTSLALGSAFNLHTRKELTCGPTPISKGGSRNEHREDVSTTMMRPFVFRYLDDPSDEMVSSTNARPVVGNAEAGVPTFDYHPLKRDEPIRANTSVRPIFGSTDKLKGSNSTNPNSFLVGFEVTSDNGTTYLYDQPVVVSKEHATNHILRHDPSLRRAGKRVVLTTDANDEPIPLDVYKETHEQVSDVPYASAFLPSLITSSEYTGAPGSQPTDNDIGWTKFTYETLSSSYESRSPYHGFWYSTGLLEDSRDDNLLSMRAKSEIVVVKKIETATHYAMFYTNQNDPGFAPTSRLDAYSAQSEQEAAAGSPVTGPSTQVMLTRIELFKKTSGGPKLVSTTFFAYDYSLVPGNPSTSNAVPGQTGKLTLRKVWTEPFKVRSPKISPIEFHYDYPNYTASGSLSGSNVPVANLSTKYAELQSSSRNPSASLQNPSYDPNNIDAWGYTGAVGTKSLLPGFFGQAGLPVGYDFRPNILGSSGTFFEAPYALKRIHMPSGAQLVVQYDRADYGSVQDSNVMQMRRLSGPDPTTSQPSLSNSRLFAVDYSDLTSGQRAMLVAELQRRFVDNREPLYADLTYQVALTSCCPERTDQSLQNVSTYLRVSAISEVAGIVTFTIGDRNAAFTDDVGDLIENSRQLPIAPAVMAYRDALKKHYRQDLSGTVLDAAWQILRMFWETATPPLTSDNDDLDDRQFPTLMPSASYLRLPMLGSKQTNIPRVSSIAMISPDGALQAGDARVIGRRYDYTERTTFGVRSSGVATSEPMKLRQEMGIVQAQADIHQDTRDGQAFRPIDVQRFELPLAEGLLPAPSIGYGCVTTTSWHDGPTNSGTSVYKYLTAKTVPTLRVEHTARQRSHSKWPDITNILLQVSSEDIVCSQGYSINVRRGHGLPLGVEHYSGKPSGDLSAAGTDPNLKLLSFTRYHYDQPESPVFIVDTVSRPFSIGNPGASIELIVENKQLQTADVLTQLQGSFQFAIPPFFAVVPVIRNHQRFFSSHVSTKLCSWPLRLRSITTSSDGVRDSTSIVAYDRRTGGVALTTAFDGYHGQLLGTKSNTHNGSITTYSQKACDHYDAMGSKQESESVVFRRAGTTKPSIPGLTLASNDNARHGSLGLGDVMINKTSGGISIASFGGNADFRRVFLNKLSRLFTIGDVIEVVGITGTATYQGRVTGRTLSATNAVFDLAVSWTTSPSTGAQAQLRILKSGRTNQVAASLGSHTFYGLDFEDAKNHAKDLQQRKSVSDDLTDWVRSGFAKIGYTYSRPLARFTVGSLATNEGVDASAYIYPPVNNFSPCAYGTGYLANLELGIQTGSWPNISYNPSGAASSKTINVGYFLRNHSTCDEAPLTNYQSPISNWKYWKRFWVSDIGDLIVGDYIDPATATRGAFDFIFGFREERFVGGVLEWNQDALTLGHVPVLNSAVGKDYTKTLGASGVIYTAFPVAQGKKITYRPTASYQAFQPDPTLIKDGFASAAGPSTYPGSFSESGTFNVASTWQPPAGAGTPDPIWRKVGAITSWNDKGLPEEMVNADDVPTTVLYTRGHLPSAIVAVGSTSTVFVDDCETGSSSLSHSGSRARSLPYTFSVGLGAITDSRIAPICSSYVARFWVVGNCTLNELYVTVSGVATLNGSSLEIMRVSKQEGMQLFEIPITAACSTIAVSTTASGPCAVDDLLVRPMESVAKTIVYDEYDRPIGTIDDEGYLSSIAYDERGSSLRSYRESIRGRDMVLDISTNEGARRRTTEELVGGVHANVGPQAMLMNDILNESFPWINTMLPIDGIRPSGIGAKGDLLRLKASPDSRELDFFPTTSDGLEQKDGGK